jgi:hypothetical protein
MAIRPGAGAPVLSFGVAQHLVSAACGELGGERAAAGGEFGVAGPAGRPGPPRTPGPGYQRYRPGVRGLKDRVAHLLEVVSGPNP